MLERLITVAALIIGILIVASDAKTNEKRELGGPRVGPQFWIDQAKRSIQEALKLKQVDGVAKNVIFFLGDGMSLPTITAARILSGQKKGHSGEEGQLSWEKFNNVALMKTYNVDKQVPDSAGTATAYLCGVKANFETVGVNENGKLADCSTAEGNEATSILEWSQKEGKLTGFITTARVTHASPAGLYAHSVSRYWENDVEKKKKPGSEKCKDIARQLVEEVPGVNINLIMGGGRAYFLPNSSVIDQPGSKGVRQDKLNLVEKWKNDKIKSNGTFEYITTLHEFNEWQPKDTDFVLGLFGDDHMQYEVDRVDGPNGQPSIAEMTRKAIKMLNKGQKGFFLFVEGGRIDHGHHDNFAMRALNDAVAMHEAVQVAVDLTSEQDTLIIVTADHSHVMTINGYPERGNPIFGIAAVSEMDFLPYTTLMYTNGLGFNRTQNGSRPNITGVDTADKDYRPLAAVPLKTETHGGDDVALYARGPMAHLFYGVQEQNYIPHVLAYASCVGDDKRNCINRKEVGNKNNHRNVHARNAGVVVFQRIDCYLVFILVNMIAMF